MIEHFKQMNRRERSWLYAMLILAAVATPVAEWVNSKKAR